MAGEDGKISYEEAHAAFPAAAEAAKAEHCKDNADCLAAAPAAENAIKNAVFDEAAGKFRGGKDGPDANEDGKLDLEEFKAFGRKMDKKARGAKGGAGPAAALAQKGGPPKPEDIMKQCDTDGKGGISPAEAKDCIPKFFAKKKEGCKDDGCKKKADEEQAKVEGAVFDGDKFKADGPDQDGSGGVDLKELEAFMKKK